MSDPYHLRGNRVAPMTQSSITNKALGFCYAFGLTKRKIKRFDRTLEEFVEYGITLDVIDDKEWLKRTCDLTIGHYDPSSFTISIPERIYKNACLGERDALFVLLHELGHLVLGHKAVLHLSNQPPKQQEDAEWQADTFAEVALDHLGFQMKQLSFDFYM